MTATIRDAKMMGVNIRALVAEAEALTAQVAKLAFEVRDFSCDFEASLGADPTYQMYNDAAKWSGFEELAEAMSAMADEARGALDYAWTFVPERSDETGDDDLDGRLDRLTQTVEEITEQLTAYVNRRRPAPDVEGA